MESHLLQMRGLKPIISTVYYLHRIVASFTDAWIETTVPNINIGNWISRIFYRCVD